MGVTSTLNNLTGGAYGAAKDAWGNAVGSAESAFAQIYHAAENTVNNILKDPLPVIETVALTYVLGPEAAGFSETTAAAMSQAAVRAANGGNMQDIALAVATSYAGAQIGQGVAAQLPPELSNTIKQVVASSSGSAAVTALRGGSLENVLQSGVAGAVNGYIASELAAQGYSKVDKSLIANAASAATSAILKGKSVSDAIGQSLASTAISAALQGNVGQINKNNELLNGTSSALGLNETYDYWKSSAQDFYDKNFTDKNPVFTNANTWADKTNQAILDYNLQQKATLADQTAFQDLYAKYQEDPSNQQLTIDTANAYQKLMDDKSSLDRYNINYQLASAKFDAFNSKLAPLQQTYQNEYVAPLQEVAQQINDISSQNEKLAADVGQQVVEYQNQVLKDDTGLVKQIGDQAVAEALKTLAPLQQQATEETPTEGNLPSGVQVAAADTGTVSDAGSSPLSVNIGGVPIYADTKGADTVKPPLGYDLMPTSMADSKPAGAYYDETQNAWFMPNKDVEQLQQDLQNPPTTTTEATLPQEVAAGDQTSSGALPSTGDTGVGSTGGLGGTGGGTGGTEDIPEIVVTAPRETEATVPIEVAAPETKPTTTPTAPITPTVTPVTPTITPVAPTTTTATPSTTQTTSPLSSLDNTPKFLDTNPRFLETKVVPGSQPHLQELKQLYSSLTPELAASLADRGIEAPSETTTDTNMPTTKFMADGGDVSKLADSLNPTSSNLGFVKPYSPNMLPAAPLMQNQMKLNPLRHLHESLLSRQRTAGGLAHGGLPQKYAEAMPEGHKPEFITGLTGYYASGKGTGQSDDIDAMLHDGDYVADADLVAALGDGSSKAGAEALEKFRRQIPHQEHAVGGAAVAAKIADGEYVFPASFVTAIGGGDNKAGAKILDKMREAIRAHKRSAPTTKIPPKAKSPLDYLKMVKG